jgi:hypothetical protein
MWPARPRLADRKPRRSQLIPIATHADRKARRQQ